MTATHELNDVYEAIKSSKPALAKQRLAEWMKAHAVTANITLLRVALGLCQQLDRPRYAF